jgi:outer membrane protein assembly factor BamB
MGTYTSLICLPVSSRDQPLKQVIRLKEALALIQEGYRFFTLDKISESGKIGFKIYSLIDGKELYFINGLESAAGRRWGAFDGSALINKETDTLFEGGENSVFYKVKLNTKFDGHSVSVSPEVVRYRGSVEGRANEGIENSVAAYKNLLFFANNQGDMQAIDSTTMKPVWAVKGKDDTDASIVVSVENGKPYLYSGTEVDKQGERGYAFLVKREALTGKTVWEKQVPAFTLRGEDAVNGGLLSTPVVGKGKMSNLVIFTVSRYKTFNGGLVIAYDKTSGSEIWRYEMPSYGWSSPVDVYDKDGNGYIVQGDSVGNLYLLNGLTGKVITKINLGANIEASPAVYNDKLVVATRGGQMYGVNIK